MGRAAAAAVIVVVVVAAALAAYMLVHRGASPAATPTSTATTAAPSATTPAATATQRAGSLVVVTDALGRRVEAPLRPSSIALLDDNGGLTLLLDAVGGRAALSAVRVWAGSLVEANNPAVYEAYRGVIHASPPSRGALESVQLVLATKSYYEGHRSELESLGKPVLVLDVSTPRGVEEAAIILGEVFGAKARAEKLVSWMRSVESLVEERLSDITLRPGLYLLAPRAWGLLAATAGARLNTTVDAVVVALRGPASPQSLYNILDERFRGTPAALHYWVCGVYEGLAYGPTWPIALLALAKAVHPAVFRDVNVTVELRSFASKWLAARLAVTPLECPPPPRHKVTIIDAAGRRVTIEAPARRIIVLYGLEDLVAVSGEYGLAHLVALNKYRYIHWRADWWRAWVEHFPWLAKLPDTGQPGYGFNPELILKLHPDALIVARFMYDRLVESGWAKRFEEAGIPVIVIDFVPHTTSVEEHLEAVKRSLLALGAVTGYTDRAERLYKLYEEKLLHIVRLAENATEKPKVLVLATWDKWRAYGRGGMYQVWITFAGGVNIAARVIPGTSGEINPEYVLRENPDVIIFTCNNNLYTPQGKREVVVIGYTVNSTKPAKEALRMLVERPGWDRLRAVREGRVYLIHHGLAHGHIFQFVALEWIAKWLHPDLFKNLDPLSDFKRFYAEYMPFPLRGVWAVGIRDP